MAYRERGHPSGDHRSEDIYKLYVTNLPPELNEDGIAQIFQEFGEIELISPHKSGWAYVSYKTYREAEHAIRALNDRSPLFLKVSFAIKKTRDNGLNCTPGITGPLQTGLIEDFRYTDSGLPPRANGRNFMPSIAAFGHNASYNQDSDAISVYPNDMDPNIYNPFESVGRYAETNAMWSRGCVNIDDFGKRHVSMGRGFTRYHIPEPHPNLERQISRVYENRRAGLYEYGEDRLQSQVGKCQYCMRVTPFKCEQCGGFYCSRDCQLADWPRHKMECKTMPVLNRRFHRGFTGGREMPSISRSSSEEQLLVPRKPGGRDLGELSGLRRPKTLAQLEVKAAVEDAAALLNGVSRREEIPRKTAIDEKPPATPDLTQPFFPNFQYNQDSQKAANGIGRGYTNDSHQHLQNRRYDRNDQRRPAINDNNRALNRSQNSGGSKEVLSSITKSAPVSDEATVEKIEAGIEFDRDPRAHLNVNNQATVSVPSAPVAVKALRVEPITSIFPENSFTPVIVVIPMPDATFWVQRKKDVPKIESMMLELQTKMPLYPTTTELVIGNMYGVQYNDIWHRATVVSTTPKSIFYVDFGNEEPPQSEEFRLLTDFPRHPPYAYKLRLSAGVQTPEITEEMELSVKMVNVDKDGIVEVVIEKETGEVVSSLVKTAQNGPVVVETLDAKVEAAEAEAKIQAAKAEAAKIEAAKAEAAKIEAAKAEAAKVEAAKREAAKAEAAKAEAAKREAAKAEAAKAEAAKAEAAKAEAAKAEAARRPKTPIPSPSKPAQVKPATPEAAKIIQKTKLPTGIDRLGVNNSGILQVYLALDNNSYAGCVLDPTFSDEFSLIFESIIETCNGMTCPPDFKPQICDFVCGKRGETWVRGYVCALGPPIRLALVDEARITPVDQVLPMPERYANVRALGAICTFNNLPTAFATDDTAEFTVTAIDSSSGERLVKGVLKTPENLKGTSLILKNWSPTPEQKGIAFADLKSTSEVCITAYSSERIMFVRSLDTQSVEKALRITQDVAKWAQGAPKLTAPPVIGQVVIAKFTDGNFYRAIVTKFKDDKFGVSYVDYGNRDFVPIEDLKILSDELKAEKSCVTKVVLKDVKTDVPPTQEVHQYLDLLVGKEQSLFCTFEGIPSKDGVILTTATGECINLKVNELLTPSWKREDPSKDTQCFTIVDLEYAKLGEEGKTTTAIVLFAGPQPFKYFLCPQDPEHIAHVTTLMPSLLKEYCESTKQHYIPRETELCLAIYEGEWYRGLCMKPSATPTQAQIHFYDFGNIDIVEHKNIREMTKDFLSPPALACICDVKNLGVEMVNNVLPANVKARLDALVPLENVVEIKILKKLDEGDYEIEMPTVRKTLVKEGLAK